MLVNGPIGHWFEDWDYRLMFVYLSSIDADARLNKRSNQCN